MEKLDEYIAYDKKTKEMVKYIRRVCKCSHSIYFVRNMPVICKYCGRTVYPTKQCEFKDKLIKERRKNKYE